MIQSHPTYTLFPYTTLFRSGRTPVAPIPIPYKPACKNSLRVVFIIVPVLNSTDIRAHSSADAAGDATSPPYTFSRSEEHTSELQSRFDIVCRLLLEKKKYTLCSRASLSRTSLCRKHFRTWWRCCLLYRSSLLCLTTTSRNTL